MPKQNQAPSAGLGAEPVETEWLQLWSMWEDGLIDGLRRELVRYVRAKLPFESERGEFAESVVAEAFDQLFESYHKGRNIREPRAWLYKVVWATAQKRLQQAESLRDNAITIESILHATPESRAVVAAHERSHAARVKAALTHAQRLLPRIGRGQVLQVMTVFLEAVELDVPDFPPSAIADTVGISEAQARTLLHRGLTRLRREAKRDGIELPSDFDPSHHDPHGVE